MTRTSGGTPSSQTGPSNGPGSGGTGFYYFEEASSPRRPGDVFELRYDGSDCPLGITKISFRYSMYGESMGYMYVVAGGSSNAIWSKSGDQGRNWHTASDVPIGASSFAFKMVRGSNWRSDAAVGDVVVTC